MQSSFLLLLFHIALIHATLEHLPPPLPEYTLNLGDFAGFAPRTLSESQLPVYPASSNAFDSALPKPTVPSPYVDYFTMNKATEELIRGLLGPGMLPPSPFVTETTPASYTENLLETTTEPIYYDYWTTTPKDQLVDFMEKSIDAILSKDYTKQWRRPSLPYYLLEEDGLIEHRQKDEKNVTGEAQLDEVEGSGSNDEGIIRHPGQSRHSSIEGISRVMPHVPKVPLDFQAAAERHRQTNSPSALIPKFVTMTRPEVPEGGFGPLLWTNSKNIRRHPGAAPKTANEFQYGSKPTYRQGFMSSVLDFLGIQSNGPASQPSELDRALTEWILQHAPTTKNTAQRSMKKESAYNLVQKFVSQSVQPLCNPQPTVTGNFNVKAFMGQWYQVMYSPLMSTTSCSMMAYSMLTESDAPYGVGSVFQTLEYSSPRLDQGLHVRHALSSGYAMVTRQGQILYRKSNTPEDIIVHVIHVDENLNNNGQYEYAILAVNCNYPLYVIARDPQIFKQKYERIVNEILRNRGLVNEMSRFLNILSPIDFGYCVFSPTFFDMS
ncbi:LiPocalin-Related protein [Ditylenchus destructor]|uniref:LiPocalin-Related protein n=1 Tax=Ditylenchus destructor TaxID=166010 RepID=A0AAD4NHM1_9BILA|nr:LiPocalin-Related protein [Ditylenchus destructor]